MAIVGKVIFTAGTQNFPHQLLWEPWPTNRLADLPTHGGRCKKCYHIKKYKSFLPVRIASCAAYLLLLNLIDNCSRSHNCTWSRIQLQFSLSMIFNSQPMISCSLITVLKSKYNFQAVLSVTLYEACLPACPWDKNVEYKSYWNPQCLVFLRDDNIGFSSSDQFTISC